MDSFAGTKVPSRGTDADSFNWLSYPNFVSTVSDRMSARRLVSGPEGTGSPASTLADLGRGDRARVLGYGEQVQPSAARRLFDLGLAPGVEVTMVRRAPLRDPVIYRVGDYEIALRRAQAQCIRVELHPERPR